MAFFSKFGYVQHYFRREGLSRIFLGVPAACKPRTETAFLVAAVGLSVLAFLPFLQCEKDYSAWQKELRQNRHPSRKIVQHSLFVDQQSEFPDNGLEKE